MKKHPLQDQYRRTAELERQLADSRVECEEKRIAIAILGFFLAGAAVALAGVLIYA